MYLILLSSVQSVVPQRLLCSVLGAAVLLLVGGCVGRLAVDESGTTPAMLDGMRVVTTPAPRTPGSGLDSETLYKLLVAEIAGQRERLDMAVENYREAARQSRDPAVIERAIRIAIYARDNAAAAELADLWLEVDPDNLDAHQVLAAVAIRNGDVPEAVNHLETVLKTDAGTLGQKLWLIATLLSRGEDQKTTLAVMERLVSDYQDNPDALLAYAHLAVQMDDLERAETLLVRLLKLQPDNSSVAMNYVSVLTKNDKQDQAIDWLQHNLGRYEDNFTLRFMYARLLTDAGRFDVARAEFDKLLEQSPDNVDVLYTLGLLALQSNQLQDAATYFNHLIELDAQQPAAHYYLGRIAEQRGESEVAADYYSAVDSGDYYIDARIRVALIRYEQSGYDAALAQLENIEADSEGGRVMLVQARAEILSREDRYDEALAIYNQALEDHPENTDLLYSRAMLAEKMDKLDLVERDLRAVIELNPEHAQALNALGYTLADRTDRLQEAYELIQRALAINPDDFYIVDSMGWVLYRMGRLDEAEKYLRRALELRNDPEVAAHLGEVLWVKGEREAARKIWDTALQSTPDDQRLLDVIKRFNP